ncbi:MAG: CotH kinase family protein [Dehalococcoidales bacterium]|nr:CotH kinase family protein [Dehalococcoidales bacterium]
MKNRGQYGLIFTVLACLLVLIFTVSLAGCGWQSAAASPAPFYPDRVVDVRFVMTDEDWTYLQQNAREEEYLKADMWYDGELLPDIALRPKGNSSLSSTIAQGSIRFSLKADLNFFNSARNLDGVKKLNFNNGFSDPSFMREILSYEIFEEMGLPTPRASFVDLWINDTHLGLYTMVEQVDQTFLQRYFTDATGNLYKPEMPAGYLNWTEEDVAEILASQDTSENSLDVNLGGGNLNDILRALGWDFLEEEETETDQLFPGFFRQFNINNPPADNVTPGFGIQGFPNIPPAGNITSNFTRRNVIIQGGGMAPAGGMGIGPGLQADYLEQMGLKTNENNPDYSALFHLLEVLNNEPDETFVEEIEKVLDVDQVLRFLAVSAALVHLDNYIGMGHNYYLYEVDGKFTIIPWDLNMSFGGFGVGIDRSSTIDFLIDEPTSGAVADRPLVARVLAVPAYLEAYHSYLTELINGAFSAEIIASRIDELAAMIRPYVKADTLKFYTYNAFEAAVGEGAVNASGSFGMVMGMGVNIGLKTFVTERITSIEKQLAGEIPSTNNGRGNGGGFFIGGGNNMNNINRRQ